MAKQSGCSAIHLPYEHPAVKVSIPVAGEHPRLLEAADRRSHPRERGRRFHGSPGSPQQTLGNGSAIAQFDPVHGIAHEHGAGAAPGNRLRLRSSHFCFGICTASCSAIINHHSHVSRASPLPQLDRLRACPAVHFAPVKGAPPAAITYLHRLGLDPEALTGAVRSAGFNPEPTATASPDARFAGELHQQAVAESGERRLAQRYLEVFGSAERIMLVDIGWSGNMQASFTRLLEPGHPNRSVRGCYMGLHGTAHENDMLGHTMDGWLTHYGSLQGVRI